MNLHFFQHTQAEGPGTIENWARNNNHYVSATRLYLGDNLPSINELDWLFIMGGPMGVYDEKKYPWLKQEKKIIEQAIKSGKTVIGICLGSQLIAEVLGAKIYKGMFNEIGWYPISLTPSALAHKSFKAFQTEEIVFHWHGDTFNLPMNSVHLASSEAYSSQAFAYDSNVYGFQFHLEFTPQTVQSLIKAELKEQIGGPYIQTKSGMTVNKENFNHNRFLLFSFLDALQTS